MQGETAKPPNFYPFTIGKRRSHVFEYRPPRVGRNPKSGEPVSLPAKHVPHFKPGKELRERVDKKPTPEA